MADKKKAAFDAEAAYEALLSSSLPPWRSISSRTLARVLGVSLQTLANWRVRDAGPPCEGQRRGAGNKVFYRADHVMMWLKGSSGVSREPWEHSRAWLVWHGLAVADESKNRVNHIIDSIDLVL